MSDAVMCSYEECPQDPVTTLMIDGEETPVCSEHIETVAEQATDTDQDQTKYPVAAAPGEEEAAAWINTTDTGQAYLSVKTEEGDYINLFARSDALQITLKQIHEAQKQ